MGWRLMIFQTVSKGSNKDTILTTIDKVWQVQQHKPSLGSKANEKGYLLPLDIYIKDIGQEASKSEVITIYLDDPNLTSAILFNDQMQVIRVY